LRDRIGDCRGICRRLRKNFHTRGGGTGDERSRR